MVDEKTKTIDLHVVIINTYGLHHAVKLICFLYFNSLISIIVYILYHLF